MFSIIPKAGAQSQRMSPALVVFHCFMDSSKEYCIAYSLDGTGDDSVCIKRHFKEKHLEKEVSDCTSILRISYFPSPIFLYMYSQEYINLHLIKSERSLSVILK